MGKSAVPAPDRKMPATNGQIVGTRNMAVPAFGRFNDFPEIITADLRELSFFTDILDPGDEDPGSPAVVTDHPCLVRHGRNDLVGIIFTMVTHRAIPREDEPFAHMR
jgi:hypothetical protein